jgi:sulfoxide reductase heme-binding subunit YedZ
MIAILNRANPYTVRRIVFVLCFVPAALMGADIALDRLGANPIQFLERLSGLWALRLLVIAMAVTPLRLLTGWNALAICRRTVGLAAFFYALVHLTLYAVVDQALVLPDIVADILKRPYITIGMVAFVILLALAATSPRSMVRRLGAIRWRNLHRLVYPAAILGCIHYEMVLKGFQVPPFYYGGILLVLFAIRLLMPQKRRPPQRAPVRVISA